MITRLHFSHEALISTRCSTVAQDFLHPPSVPGNIETVEASQQRLEVLL